jgi:hypothetical protein
LRHDITETTMNESLQQPAGTGATPIDYDCYRARAVAERRRARRAAFAALAQFARGAASNIFFQPSGKSRVIGPVLACCALAAALSALPSGGPADAAPNTAGTCEKKYQGCLGRCRAKYDINKLGSKVWADKVVACSTRTCLKQYNNCIASATPGKLEPPPPKFKPRPNQASGPYISDPKPVPNPLTSTTNNSAPLATGILDGGVILHGQGPSSTGSPAGGGMKPPSAPPAGPPVILR